MKPKEAVFHITITVSGRYNNRKLRSAFNFLQHILDETVLLNMLNRGDIPQFKGMVFEGELLDETAVVDAAVLCEDGIDGALDRCWLQVQTWILDLVREAATTDGQKQQALCQAARLLMALGESQAGILETIGPEAGDRPAMLN